MRVSNLSNTKMRIIVYLLCYLQAILVTFHLFLIGCNCVHQCPQSKMGIVVHKCPPSKCASMRAKRELALTHHVPRAVAGSNPNPILPKELH